MPEMPEVEIIRRGLSPRLLNRQIADLELLLPRLVKWPAPEAFGAMVIGRTVTEVGRRGKYLLLRFDNGSLLVIHLRMTGRLTCIRIGEARDMYARIVFRLNDGEELVYADTRTLGTLYALREDELWRVSGLCQMGPEPLTETFTSAYLEEKLIRHRGKIKAFLLNQKYVGGLGNIYVDECLLLAGIHPNRQGCSLTKSEISRLHTAVNRVIAAGIEDGGTTFRDYRDGEGKKGRHQERLFAYGRTGLPCRICGAAIERIEVAGRGTHLCPVCQK